MIDLRRITRTFPAQERKSPPLPVLSDITLDVYKRQGLRGGAPYGAWGNAPTVAPLNLLKEEKQVRQLRRRQRSVPAHKLKNFQ